MSSSQSDEAPYLVPGLLKMPLSQAFQGIARDPKRDTAKGRQDSPWLTVKEAAGRARCGIKLIYREVKAERLQAARVGGRRELRFRAEWVDDWLTAHRVIK